MAKKLFKNALTKMFGVKTPRVSQSDLLVWAKTEYGKDWQWAYEFMLSNPGMTPDPKKIGVGQ